MKITLDEALKTGKVRILPPYTYAGIGLAFQTADGEDCEVDAPTLQAAWKKALKLMYEN
jgi:hypothetical protein